MTENPYGAPQKLGDEPQNKRTEEPVWSILVWGIVFGAVVVLNIFWHDERRRELHVYALDFVTIAAIYVAIQLAKRSYRRATRGP